MMFKIPTWIKPNEITKFKYWLHLAVLSAVSLYIIGSFYVGKPLTSFDDMWNLKNIIYSVPALAAGDIVAHSILKLN